MKIEICFYIITFLGEEADEEGAILRILHLLGDATGMDNRFERLRNNTPFLECVTTMLNVINSKKPVKFDMPGEISAK